MDERSSDQIQRDIERSRAQMSETIDALERRLSPGELVDELWGRMKGGQTSASIGETVRDHPIPLALMGLGLGWLAIEKATESRTDLLRGRYEGSGQGTYARAEGRVGPYRGDEVIDPDARYGNPDHGGRISDAAEAVKDRVADIGSEVKDRVSGLGGELRDRVASASDAAREKMSGAGDRMHAGSGPDGHDSGPGMGERAHHLREGMSEQAHHLRDSARRELGHARETMHQRGGQLENTFRSLLSDYPLALGAVTFGLGLAAGASAPTTRREDELMGHASDSLRDEVKEAARETTERARTVATEAARAAGTEARDEGMGQDLESKAERVIHAATSAAKEEAKTQGLTGDDLKERGREIGRETAMAARPGSSSSPDSPRDRMGAGHGDPRPTAPGIGTRPADAAATGGSVAAQRPTAPGAGSRPADDTAAGGSVGAQRPAEPGAGTGMSARSPGDAGLNSGTSPYRPGGGLTSPTANRPAGGAPADRKSDRLDRP